MSKIGRASSMRWNTQARQLASFRRMPSTCQPKYMRYETENHIVVVADREQVDEGMVEVGDEDLTIHDRVSKVQTQGRRGQARQ